MVSQYPQDTEQGVTAEILLGKCKLHIKSRQGGGEKEDEGLEMVRTQGPIWQLFNAYLSIVFGTQLP